MTIDDYATLTFERPDFEKFPLLSTAYEAARRGGNMPCVMNAANEIAVAAFLRDQIGFTQIYEIVSQTMNKITFISRPTYEEYVKTNTEARAFASSLI